MIQWFNGSITQCFLLEVYHEKTILSFLFILSLAPFHLDANELSAKKEMIAQAAQARDASSLTALITILEADPGGYTRAFAAWSLGEIGDTGARPALSKALNDIDKGVRVEAGKALNKLK